jgi:tetratricopeptide (TPR) repeat protein
MSVYIPFLKWRKDPTQEDKEVISLLYKKVQGFGMTDPQQMFIQAFYLNKRLTKFDMTKIETGTGMMATMSILFSYTGISFSLSRNILEFVKDKVDMGDVRSVLYYRYAQVLHYCASGDWPEEIDFDRDLINRNLGIGEFFFTPIYQEWTGFLYIARGNFQATEWIVQKLSDTSEIYDTDYSKLVKFNFNTYLLMKSRKLNDALKEAGEGIQFDSGIAGYSIWVIYLSSLKARVQILMGDVGGAKESLDNAEKIKSKVNAAPFQLAGFALSRFILSLCYLEEAVKKIDKTAISLHRSNALKEGKNALKLSNRYAVTKIETLKQMGIYYWFIGKQRKAMQWWRKAISEGQRLNDRLELSRTYFEVGKRLLEPKSKYKELDGIKAEDYLDKARVMFEEMDLQWDLDELEKLRLQMGT